MRAARFAATIAAALGLAAATSGAEERSVQGVGAAAVTGAGSARDAALREAIAAAVRQVAFELLPELDPAAAGAAVDQALAPDPRTLASRYRILEDRGEGPVLLLQESGVETEYVMVVQAEVDVARVRQRLERAGLLAAPQSQAAFGQRVRVVLEDLDGYAAYMAVRTLLEEIGARDALPLEIERGRAVLEVETRSRPDDLLDSLLRSAPPELRIEALGVDAASITLRAHFLAPPLGGEAP